ncbi:uncharacterized protein NECHADRAFT_78449 [Fusarium vanettenii 77-13-4]|uniref:Uncharacterized protein n=1 Tax=Fusarium vanettenii (strain ATCC MYA-4622 / CBS 123669 / FGSC 9596 / NRRL 45880 / 77-13-4) TaxID=660122 RepID=C7ZFQ8_FUSV7|nr:uncharacterized protein NECHADRAFT_78449 [Fusarium vanettenii 77-13-4]EEU37214.1 hypothetical protein NECHADRAFT_78449 [Fusarium vanettenii 77-13-4]
MAKRKFRPIIYLNGYAGVGKRTIANELCQLLLNAKVISNHLLIDTAAVVFEKNTREHELLYTTWRGALWSRIASSTTHDTIWIFTDYQPLSGTSRGYLNIAASRRSPFISIILDCAINESLKRAASGDTDDYNTEPKDLKALGGLREEDIFRFGGELEMELDETDLSPTEAARRICDHVYRVVPNNLPEQGV